MARVHPKPHLVHVVEPQVHNEDLTTPGADINATLATLRFNEATAFVTTTRQLPTFAPLTDDDRRYMAMSRRLQNRFGR